MKNLTLLLVHLLFVNLAIGQSTKELFSLPGYEIIMTALGGGGIPDVNLSLFYESDTLVCGESVLKYDTNYGESVLVSIQEGKVFLVDSCQSQRLIFDFDISVGDSIDVKGLKTDIVSISDTILDDNRVRRTYRTRAPEGIFPRTELFIEGIGSEFYGFDYTGVDTDYSTYFSCIGDSDGKIYLSPYTNPIICDDFSRNLSSTTDQASIQNVTTYPNPTSDILYVQSDSNIELEYILYSSQIEKVDEGQLTLGQESIDLSNLHSGIYYIRVTGKYLLSPLVKRVVKM